MEEEWIDACAVEDIEPEDVLGFQHDGHIYALYRTEDEQFYATDGLCTHEKVDLSGGFVMDTVIECPKHNGRFDFTTGKAIRAPACVDLRTYPVEVRNGRLFLKISSN